MKNTNQKLSKLLIVIILLLICRINYAHLTILSTSQIISAKQFDDTTKTKNAQLAQDVNVGDTILSFAEKMPEFPGGRDAMMNFLSLRLRYPNLAIQNGISGRVFVQFVINKHGKIGNVKALKGIGGGCDEEAIRIVKLFPDWIPGQQQGKLVDVYYTIPILFQAKEVEEEALQFVEQMPGFPGGTEAMMEFLNSNIRYPAIAIEMGITGRVILQFVIDKLGMINNIKVLRGIGGGCDEEAIRVVKAMPPWIPGRQNGKVVPVYFTLPVVFQLGKHPNYKSDDKELKSSLTSISGFFNSFKIPVFPGGNDSLNQFVSRNLKYPKEAEEKGIGGIVSVHFKVLKTGKIINPKVVKKVYPSIDAEALRVVSLFPDWNPAIENKRPVDSEYTLEFTFLDRALEYPGGLDSLNSFLQRNLDYPPDALQRGITGKVMLHFTVSEKGTIMKIRIRNSIGGGCDEEAIRLISISPAWIPARIGGKPVSSDYTLEIPFSRMDENQIFNSAKPDTIEKQKENNSLKVPETMPQFPGGADAMMRFLSANIRYPEEAAENGIKGRIILTFIINKNGEIRNIKLVHGIGGGCDEEAIRVVSLFPKMVPGQQKGQPTDVFFTLPVNFSLKE